MLRMFCLLSLSNKRMVETRRLPRAPILIFSHAAVSMDQPQGPRAALQGFPAKRFQVFGGCDIRWLKKQKKNVVEMKRIASYWKSNARLLRTARSMLILLSCLSKHERQALSNAQPLLSTQAPAEKQSMGWLRPAGLSGTGPLMDAELRLSSAECSPRRATAWEELFWIKWGEPEVGCA